MFVYSEEINTDVNGDGEVNILDLVRIAASFGQPVSAENAVADVNGDGEINILDLVRVAQDFGKSCVSDEPDPAPTQTIYTTGDVIPTLPSSGFWFPSYLSRVSFVSGGGVTTITLGAGGYFVYDGITYSSASG